MKLHTRNLPVFPLSSEPVRPEVSRSVRAVEARLLEGGPEDGPRIGLLTLGCDKNTVDSERVMAALVGHGARVTGALDDAEVVVINTCGFIQEAKEESIETILEACSMKGGEGGVRAVVAVGCLVQRYKDDLAREIPEVDLFLGLTEMDRLVPELRGRGLLPEAAVPLPTMERPLRILSTDTPHTSHLKISEGCDHTCAFCAIPHMRGLHRSAPLEELVREARELEARGVVELNVISQDTTWYGKDLRRAARAGGGNGRASQPPLLPDLLEALLGGTTIPWFRLFYMYPSGIRRELVELMARDPRLLPYLDLPIQHGSDSVLARMRRPERQATIRQKVGWLREAVPGITLRTTVIVGFPGETEEEFQELLELLQEIRFDRVGVFPYSVEEGTRAAEMEGQVAEALKRERMEELQEVQREISFQSNLELVGRRETLLVDRSIGDDPDYRAVGRIAAQAPEVDGVTHLLHGNDPGGPDGEEGGHLDGVAAGRMIEVEIVDVEEYDLIARRVDRG